MFGNLFKSRSEKRIAQSLYDSCVRAARQPALYLDDGVPDTLEGRLELIMLHTALLITELKASGGEAGSDLSQEVFDVMFDDFDAAMREMGVGDSGIGKKIRFMAEGFYGRARVYSAALKGEGEESLEALLRRNVFASEAPVAAENRLSLYVKKSAEILAQQGFGGLRSAAEAGFPVAEVQS